MLKKLRLENFVLIKQADINFSAGFTALTGETGAGKSLLTDAISLLLGGKANPSWIRENTNAMSIYGCFDVSATTLERIQGLFPEIKQSPIEVERVVTQSGKQRNMLNQKAISISQLKLLGDVLLDIQGQHAYQLLSKADHQLNLIDQYAGLLEHKQQVALAWHNWQSLQQRFDLKQRQSEQLAERQEVLRWQVDLLDQLSPEAGEWDALSEEQKQLTHTSELINGLAQVIQILNEDDDSVGRRMASVVAQMNKLSDFHTGLQDILGVADQVVDQVNELSYQLNRILQGVQADPDRLNWVEDRMSLWLQTARKLKIPPVDLMDFYLQKKQEFMMLSIDEDLDQLKESVIKAQASYLEAAQELSIRRREVLPGLSLVIEQYLAQLGMVGAQFEVHLLPGLPSKTGLDKAEFAFAGHAGVKPQSILKIASGGELSRVSLAVNLAIRSMDQADTMIFDEVDSGVGGQTAETVGRLLRQLSNHHQVLAVTHLPQVAAKAHHQIKIQKIQENGQMPFTRLQFLNDQERVEEIARMLGGAQVTENIQRAARDLLQENE